MPKIVTAVTRLHTWRRQILATLRPFGITLDQAWTLLSISKQGPSTMGAVADNLHIARGVLTKVVERLESRGLVSTKRPDSDRRTVVVSLTTTGMEQATAIRESLGQPDILDVVAKQNAWAHQAQKAVAPLGLTFAQAVMLLVINESESTTPGKIADLLNLSRGNMTGIVERVERGGLISTRRDKPDKRKIHLKLTDDGADLIPQIMDTLDQFAAPAA